MKQRVLIALLTVVVLGAGYLAGIWTERHSCKVPKPPQLLGELSTAKPAPANSLESTPAPDTAKLVAQIEQLKPEIEKFRVRMNQIDRELDRDIETILRPDQLEVFRGIVKKYADLRAQEAAANSLTTPLTPEEIVKLQQKPLYKMLAIVVVPMRLEWNVKDLQLDDAQKEQLREILKKRREKFLALVDSSPPPSLTLSRLAPMAQRLIETSAPAKPKHSSPE
jgi:hypothetical protein